MRFILLFISTFLLYSCKSDKPAAPSVQLPDLVEKVRVPKAPSTGKSPLLILLHGYGSYEEDLFSLANFLDDRLHIVAYRAPITMSEKGYAWYNLAKQDDSFLYDIKEVEHAVERVLSGMDAQLKNKNIDPEQVYIGGFSQGAMMALAIGLTNDKIKGVIAMSGELLKEFQIQSSSSNRNKELEVFLSHGKNDPVVPFAAAEQCVAYLQSQNIEHTTDWSDDAHTITNENLIAMRDWLSQRIQ